MLGIQTQTNYANMNNNYNSSNYAINNSNDMQSPLIQSPNISLNNNINTNQNIINTNMTESQPIQYNQPPIQYNQQPMQYNQQPIQYQNYSSPNNNLADNSNSAVSSSANTVNNTQSEPDFKPFMKNLQQKIKRNWNPPQVNSAQSVVVKMKIAKDGITTITYMALITDS